MSLPIIKRKDLPNIGLTKDWSNVPLNQMVQVSSMEFCVDFDQNIRWELEFEKILQRAEELNGRLVVYRMTPTESNYTLADHYIFQFKSTEPI